MQTAAQAHCTAPPDPWYLRCKGERHAIAALDHFSVRPGDLFLPRRPRPSPRRLTPRSRPSRPSAATENNACGCYRDKDDKCHCIKVSKAKLKCQCENDCEPPECAAKRQHDEEKAAELALKKTKERDKKAQVEAKKAQAQRDKERKAEQAKKEKEKAKENSDPRWKLE